MLLLTMRPKAILSALLLTLASLAQAQDDVPTRAMKDELARSISQIQLQKMDKPYFLAYRMDDISRTAVSATLGSVTEEQPSRMRLIGVEVRVGDYALDNSNYVSLSSFGRGGAGNVQQHQRSPARRQLPADSPRFLARHRLAIQKSPRRSLRQTRRARNAPAQRRHPRLHQGESQHRGCKHRKKLKPIWRS